MTFLEENTKPKEVLICLKNKSEKYWLKRGRWSALEFFHEVAQRVPAYRNFLDEHNINPESVRTMEDFSKIPLSSKANYLQKYPIAELCWDGEFTQKQWMLASTSGSTGEPYYFPRAYPQDIQFAFTAEMCLLDYYEIENKNTLFIDCFALGIWIGGIFMFQAIKYLIDQGNYSLTLATPGADKTETLKAVKALGHLFDQIIIAGYGPLVKDLIDDGIKMGIQWGKFNVKYFFAAEGFTEGFRDYIHERGGLKDIYKGSINHYGTADLGTMSHETPLSILVRRLALTNEDLYREIFYEGHKMPTLTQFIPELYFFEELDQRLVCTARGGLPLIRYDLKDIGGVITLEKMSEIFTSHGLNLQGEYQKHTMESNFWQLPFVYVGERADFTVSIYSVNIYPECIRKALEVEQLQDSLTVKFSMIVEFDKQQNQYLEINVEMKSGIEPSKELQQKTLESIIYWLKKENSEWRDFYTDPEIRHKVTPVVVLRYYQDEDYFKSGRKQKWVKKRSS